MTAGIENLGAAYRPIGPAQARFVPSAPVDPLAAPPKVDRVELSTDVMPAELAAEIDFASERAAELASQNRELHFAKDEKSGRIVVQVRDLDANVIRTIPNAAALDVMAGADIF